MYSGHSGAHDQHGVALSSWQSSSPPPPPPPPLEFTSHAPAAAAGAVVPLAPPAAAATWRASHTVPARLAGPAGGRRSAPMAPPGPESSATPAARCAASTMPASRRVLPVEGATGVHCSAVASTTGANAASVRYTAVAMRPHPVSVTKR
jgi:hypothetical protein